MKLQTNKLHAYPLMRQSSKSGYISYSTTSCVAGTVFSSKFSRRQETYTQYLQYLNELVSNIYLHRSSSNRKRMHLLQDACQLSSKMMAN